MSEPRILLPADKEALVAYGKARLAARVSDPMEREMQSWSARWRAEALDHYLGLGWSFAVFNEGRLQGYVLGQPFLFYRGLTQTLWIEQVAADTPEIGRLLLDTAYRWARDKHLQCVVVENSEDIARITEDWPKARLLEDRYVEIRSSRWQ